MDIVAQEKKKNKRYLPHIKNQYEMCKAHFN